MTTSKHAAASKKAEELGYNSVWCNDHLIAPAYVKKFPEPPPNFFEPLVTLSAIALSTEKIKLATGVIVLPQRNPVILAKQVSTLDVLSNGRLILGVGIGAYREEFEAINPCISRKKRGLIFEEYLRAVKILLSQEVASFSGKFISFNNIEMYPKPVQSKIPIYIGGNSKQAIQRAALYGDGWFPALLTPSEIMVKSRELREYLLKAGRCASDVEISPQFVVSIARDSKDALKTFRRSRIYEHLKSLRSSTLKDQKDLNFEARNLIGSPADIINQIERYGESGITSFAAIVFTGNNVREVMESMTLFAKEVIPCFK